MGDWLDQRRRVADIEKSLRAAIKARSSCDFETREGDLFARFYGFNPSAQGGSELAAELNLTAIAADIAGALDA